MALLSEEQQSRVARAIAAVERETDAELVTVLTPQADNYLYIPALWAALAALLTPGVLSLTPFWLQAQDLMWAQLLVFLALAALLRLPPILHRLIPRRVSAYRAGNLARRQFLENRLHHTGGHTGVLIFVSEAEHYVEILADRGVSQYISDAQWQEIVDNFVAQIKRGEIEEGFLSCIQRCGDLLQQYVPATHERNELPNHLVLL